MNTLPVTRLFVQAHTYRTPSSREAERAAIAAAMASYTGTIKQIEPYKHKPVPARRDWIDPETVLKRNRDKPQDPRILEAIRSMPNNTCAEIAKHLRRIGIRIQLNEVDRIATLSGMQRVRA